MNILIVDDNTEILDIIKYHLSKHKYNVYCAMSGEEAMEIILNTPIDLAILDVMLPRIDGFSLCEQIRINFFFPILFLTSKVSEEDKIKGLVCGGDDYMLKPFSSKELMARVSSLLRRNTIYNRQSKSKKSTHHIHNLFLDEDSSTVTVNNHMISFTDIEYKILLILLKNRGHSLCVKLIFEKVWGELFTQTSHNTIVVHIKNIRKKLHQYDKETEYIHTVWGKGYEIY